MNLYQSFIVTVLIEDDLKCVVLKLLIGESSNPKNLEVPGLERFMI